MEASSASAPESKKVNEWRCKSDYYSIRRIISHCFAMTTDWELAVNCAYSALQNILYLFSK
jgi:hypothetical protein